MANWPPGEVKVFVSYSRDDTEARDKILERMKPLQDAGLAAVWWDRLIPPAKDWRKEILRKLGEADIVVAILSNSYVKSPVCMKEIRRAREAADDGRTTLVPIHIDDSKVKLPGVDRWQWVDLADTSSANVGAAIERAVLEWATPSAISNVFRPHVQFTERIMHRIGKAREIWLQSLSGRGWFTEYKTEFDKAINDNKATTRLLFMDPTSSAFKAVAGFPYEKVPFEHSTDFESRRLRTIELLDKLEQRDVVDLRVTEMPILAATMIIDPPFKLGESGALVEEPHAGSYPVLFLELPANPRYRKPLARAFWFDDDKELFRERCEAFATSFHQASRWPNPRRSGNENERRA